MYRWRKLAGPRWLRVHDELLWIRAGGALAIIERQTSSRSQLEIYCKRRRQTERLVAQFGGRIERLPRDWLERVAREQKRHLIKIGRRLIVTNVGEASALRKSQGSHILIIPAAGAFGTGEHATTAMCLQLLERISRAWKAGWSMLDAGTGSGIIALAACYFGARNVIAIDSDRRAISIAKGNARLNRICGVRFEMADAIKLKTRRKFDVIVANLYSELLIAAVPIWKPLLKRAGFLILSGVLCEQARGVVRALRDHKLMVQKIYRRGKWISIAANFVGATDRRALPFRAQKAS
jgi:ribosomal protein L11 methyltransferase